MKIGEYLASSERRYLAVALAGFFVFSATVVSGFAQSATDVLPTTGQPKNQVVATIPVGAEPVAVVVNPTSKLVYVANEGSNTVSVIEATTNTVATTIPVGSAPSAIAIAPDGATLYVGNAALQQKLTVSVVATPTNTVTATIDTGIFTLGGGELAVSPDGTKVYVTVNEPEAGVTVIDTATNQISGTITISYRRFGDSLKPGSVIFSPSGRFAYVTSGLYHMNGFFISKIDTASEKQISSTSLGGYGGAWMSIHGHMLYMTTQNHLIVFDTSSNTVVKRVSFANFLGQNALTPDGKYLYVTHPNKVLTMNTATDELVGAPIQIGQGAGASALAIAPDGLRAYVANYFDGTVSVIDISTQ
jgi:YVTN family beta-propeller protein